MSRGFYGLKTLLPSEVTSPTPKAFVWARLENTRPGVSLPDRKGIWEVLRERLNPALYRPGRSPDVIAVPLTSRRDQSYHILTNRRLRTYLRLAPQDHHLWTLMDGTRSVKDLVFEYFTKFGALAFDRVVQLVMHLRHARMLSDFPADLFAALRRALRTGRGQSIPRVSWQIISGQRTFIFRRVDGLIGWLHGHGGWVFYTLPAQIFYIGVSIVGGWLFFQHLASGRFNLFQAGGSYAKGLFLLTALNYLSIIVHESGHALTCKHYGANVNGAGAMLYFGMPAFFVDTTDVWTKPAHARIATSWAGPYSGVILAGLCSIIVQLVPTSPFALNLHRLAFLWIVILLFNMIPLLELDGYFMLIDWLEIPMLRAKALSFVRKELWAKVRRRERLAGQDRLLGWYGVLSLAFSALVTILALLSWQRRLAVVANDLWGGGLGSKALLFLLALVLSLPLALSLAGRAFSTSRAAAAWARTKWHQPLRRTVREREVLLRHVHFLSPLSEEELSQVAVRMRRMVFGPGDTVIREGEEGDRFFVIEAGTAEVFVTNEILPRRTLVRGDYFGEIALLEHVPRTATVCAASRLSVLSLGKGEFDYLLAPHVAASAQIDKTIQTLKELRRFSIFADLSSQELDALASKLIREQFPPGAVVIREGDQGDSFYLVESGQAEAIARGQRVGILRRGDYFGEIALLLNVPRQSTVRALTLLDVFKLDRADFEALVATTLHKVSGAIAEVGRERLAILSGMAGMH